LVQSAIPSSIGPQGEVWFAKTTKGKRVFSYVFVSDLSSDWSMIPSDIALDDGLIYRAFESSSPTQVTIFSKDSPLPLKVSNILATLVIPDSSSFASSSHSVSVEMQRK
jgi:hypothetical protein